MKNLAMKKILLLLVLLVMAVGVQAQTAAGRTASTKVSDALGLMPARDQAEFGRLMDDLVCDGCRRDRPDDFDVRGYE